MTRRPRRAPLSSGNGAIPTRAAAALPLSVPNCGNLDSTVVQNTLPTRKAAQHLALAAPGLRAPHGLVDVIVDLGDAALQVSDMLAQLFTHLRAGALKSLLLCHPHLEQLVAPGRQFLH